MFTVNNCVIIYILSVRCEFPPHPLSVGNSVLAEVDRVPSLEGSNVTFSCPPGLVFVGHNSSTCINRGKWDPDPREVSCKGEC